VLLREPLGPSRGIAEHLPGWRQLARVPREERRVGHAEGAQREGCAERELIGEDELGPQVVDDVPEASRHVLGIPE
jgi:hypothetical protein